MIESIYDFLNCNLDVGNVVAFFSLCLSGIAIYLSVRQTSTLTVMPDAVVDSFPLYSCPLRVGSELEPDKATFDFDMSLLLFNRGNASFYLDYVKLLGPKPDKPGRWVSWAGDVLQAELPANSSKAVRLKFNPDEAKHDYPDVFLFRKPDQFQLKCEVRLFMPDGIEHIISVPMTLSTDEDQSVTEVTAKPEKLKYHSLQFRPSFKRKRPSK